MARTVWALRRLSFEMLAIPPKSTVISSRRAKSMPADGVLGVSSARQMPLPEKLSKSRLLDGDRNLLAGFLPTLSWKQRLVFPEATLTIHPKIVLFAD